MALTHAFESNNNCDVCFCGSFRNDLVHDTELLADVVDDIKDEVNHLVGVKFDTGKPRMDLLPMDALLEVAKVLMFGANKYGDRNWEKGIDVQRLRAAEMRHDAAVEMGELYDKESGIMHTAHKACDTLMELALRLREVKCQKE